MERVVKSIHTYQKFMENDSLAFTHKTYIEAIADIIILKQYQEMTEQTMIHGLNDLSSGQAVGIGEIAMGLRGLLNGRDLTKMIDGLCIQGADGNQKRADRIFKRAILVSGVC